MNFEVRKLRPIPHLNLLITVSLRFILLQSAQNRIYIKKGQVVNHDGITNADVYIEDGKVKYVGPGSDFVVPGGVRIIDATGRLLMPGGIDPHTHFQLPFGGAVSVDDFYQGTKAAVAGGTTMISKLNLIS